MWNLTRLPAWGWIVLAVAILAGLHWAYRSLHTERMLGRADPLLAGQYRCLLTRAPLELVVEGTDPLTRNGRVFPVRLAGIAAPDGAAPGAAPGEWLPPGTLVRLEFDRQRFDDQRYPLAWVFCDGRLVNAELVARGMAVPDPLPGSSAPWTRMVAEAAPDPSLEQRP